MTDKPMSAELNAVTCHLVCAFCGVPREELQFMIAGPVCSICNVCAGYSKDIMETEINRRAALSATQGVPDDVWNFVRFLTKTHEVSTETKQKSDYWANQFKNARQWALELIAKHNPPEKEIRLQGSAPKAPTAAPDAWQPRVEVRFDEIVGYGEIQIEWMDDRHVSVAINDRRFILSSKSDVKLNRDFPAAPNQSGGENA